MLKFFHFSSRLKEKGKRMDEAIANAKQNFEKLRDEMIEDFKQGNFAYKWKGIYY